MAQRLWDRFDDVPEGDDELIAPPPRHARTDVSPVRAVLRR